jgi:hypothetical protein
MMLSFVEVLQSDPRRFGPNGRDLRNARQVKLLRQRNRAEGPLE